jgi:hypothetical protein
MRGFGALGLATGPLANSSVGETSSVTLALAEWSLVASERKGLLTSAISSGFNTTDDDLHGVGETSCAVISL